MHGNLPAFRTHTLALLGLGLAFAMRAALADPIEVVVVEAARTVKTTAPSSVATAHDVSLQGWVRCGDLDLATSAGASELAKRIEQTAKSLCKELDDAYPLIEDGACVKNAVNKAMADAHKAIGAQRAAGKSP
jgi:UrcA family protein